MLLKLNEPLESVDWLFSNLENENLIILDATLPKITAKKDELIEEKTQIKNAVFFDLKINFQTKKLLFLTQFYQLKNLKKNLKNCN